MHLGAAAIHERKTLTAAVSFFFFPVVFYDIVTAFVLLFFVVLSAEGWDWKTERSSSITNTKKPVLQENLLMRAGWRRSGCTHDPTCPAHSRVGGLWAMTGNFLCPPCSHEPIFSPGSTAGYCSGPGLVTCKELLEGMSPSGLLCLFCSMGLALVWWQTVSALA